MAHGIIAHSNKKHMQLLREEIKPAFLFACDLAAVSFIGKGLQKGTAQKVQHCNKWNLKCKLTNPKVTLF
jgi:hypothetical protein